jgi:hypothetical protein
MTQLVVQERTSVVSLVERQNVLTVLRRPTRILLAGGVRGERGYAGVDGASAYQVWIAGGHVGTEQEFLDSLKGVKGDPGNAGAAGASAYQVWLAAGHQGTEADFLASLVGPQGPQGPSAVLSGYVSATQNYTSLVYAEVPGLSVELPSTGVYQLILVVLHSNEADADLRWRLQAAQCTATAHLQTVYSSTNQAQTGLNSAISVTVSSDQANRITTVIGVINVTAIGGASPRIYVEAAAGTSGSTLPSAISIGSCVTLTKVS